jgi:hypothetical protein
MLLNTEYRCNGREMVGLATYRQLRPCWSCGAQDEDCYEDCDCAKCMDPEDYAEWKNYNPEEYEQWLEDNEE